MYLKGIAIEMSTRPSRRELTKSGYFMDFKHAVVVLVIPLLSSLLLQGCGKRDRSHDWPSFVSMEHDGMRIVQIKNPNADNEKESILIEMDSDKPSIRRIQFLVEGNPHLSIGVNEALEPVSINANVHRDNAPKVAVDQKEFGNYDLLIDVETQTVEAISIGKRWHEWRDSNGVREALVEGKWHRVEKTEAGYKLVP